MISLFVENIYLSFFFLSISEFYILLLKYFVESLLQNVYFCQFTFTANSFLQFTFFFQLNKYARYSLKLLLS